MKRFCWILLVVFLLNLLTGVLPVMADDILTKILNGPVKDTIEDYIDETIRAAEERQKLEQKQLLEKQQLELDYQTAKIQFLAKKNLFPSTTMVSIAAGFIDFANGYYINLCEIIFITDDTQRSDCLTKLTEEFGVKFAETSTLIQNQEAIDFPDKDMTAKIIQNLLNFTKAWGEKRLNMVVRHYEQKEKLDATAKLRMKNILGDVIQRTVNATINSVIIKP